LLVQLAKIIFDQPISRIRFQLSNLGMYVNLLNPKFQYQSSI